MFFFRRCSYRNLCVSADCLLKSSSNFFQQFPLQQKHLYTIKSSLSFAYSRQHLQSLCLIPHSSHFLLSCPYFLLILWSTSAILSTRFDNELAITLVLSINVNLQDMVLVSSSPFLVFFIYFLLGLKKLCVFLCFLLGN